MVNLAPAVIAAEPGRRTLLDLPCCAAGVLGARAFF